MQLQYFANLKDSAGNTTRFDMDPKIPSEPDEEYDQDMLDNLHAQMKDAIQGLDSCRPDARLTEWWLADENGNIIDQGTKL